jgi:membrane fusion protein (multidrug efflux system)
MKPLYITLFSALLLFSCGSKENSQSLEQTLASNDLATIQAKRHEISTKQQELDAQLKQLDAKISILDTSKRMPLITTFNAKNEVFEHFLELQGNVNTKTNIVIYPEYSGILQSVVVKEGQYVSKGQTLAKIDDGGLSQQLAQIQIQTALAKTTFERQERLWNQKIGSEIQFLQAKSAFEAQQEAVNQMKHQISKTVVKAPFNGTIDEIITEQGSVVAPGQSQLFRIINLNEMYIETDVPESYLTSVVKNKKVTVNFPILGTSMDAKIRQAGNFINPANRTFKIEVAVPNKNKTIKPNLTAKLKINDYTNTNAFLIPQSIVSENSNGQQYIYVLNNKNDNNEGIANRVIIETGKTQGDVIEVLNGLKDGDEIIDEGARSVKDGQTVKIINK